MEQGQKVLVLPVKAKSSFKVVDITFILRIKWLMISLFKYTSRDVFGYGTIIQISE